METYTGQEIVDICNKQILANKQHLKFLEDKFGEGWLYEGGEYDFYIGAITALHETAAKFVEDKSLIESIPEEK